MAVASLKLEDENLKLTAEKIDPGINKYLPEKNGKKAEDFDNSIANIMKFKYRGYIFGVNLDIEKVEYLGKDKNTGGKKEYIIGNYGNSTNKKYVENENKVYKNSGVEATIPIGFRISDVSQEQTIDNGLVIEDKLGNEFVWVPIQDVTKMYREINGKNRGILYNFAEDGTEIIRADGGTNGWREPDVVPDSNYETETQLEEIGIALENRSKEGFKKILQKEFDDMISSVEENKGFYIGRYETGNLNTNKVVVRKNNTQISNQTWYQTYLKGKTMYGEESSVVSSLIWGSQWDQTLIWMKNEPNTIGGKYVKNSTGRGNYDSTFKATGSTLEYAVKNIYDMAGNVWEWTNENNNLNARVFRRWFF